MIAPSHLVPAAAPRPRPRRGVPRRLAAGLAVALLAVAAVLLVVAQPWQGGAACAAVGGFAPVAVPDRATDGVIAFAIPAGAAVAQQEGIVPYAMPATIRLGVGDRVVVRNDDTFPHMVLNSLVEPGTTSTLVFDEPGIQAVSSGCTANGGTMNSFTSVIVSARS